MRDKERSSSSSTSPSSSSSSSTASIDSTPLINIKGGGRSYNYIYNYKPWALAAILLLTLWSMFASSITLKQRTDATLHLSSDDIESALNQELDVLEVEEREKVVRHMWDVYKNSKRSSNLGLPKFWQEAFEAAYEYLVSDDPCVRNYAVLEIAKMSMMSADLGSSTSSVSQPKIAGGAVSKSTKQELEHHQRKAIMEYTR